MKVPVYNLEKKPVGEIELPDTVFARSWNGDLVHQAISVQGANRRKPLAHVRMRGEVRGGGKKPWRQKGTGRARHGSIRSPLWRGGGKAHGPRNEKIYARKMNKKMARAALAVLLSRKLKDKELFVIESLKPETPKTKDFAAKLKQWPSSLLVFSPENSLVRRVTRNIPRIKAVRPDSLNAEDVAKYSHLLLERDAALTIH